MKTTTSLLAIMVLAGSLSLSTAGVAAKKYKIAKGAHITLHKEITIPAHRASIYIQGGRILPYSTVDQYQVHCKFEVRHILDKEQLIRPDKFTVTKSWQMEASLNKPIVVARYGGSGSGKLTYSSYMRLRSKKQPDVIMLTCEFFGEASNSEHATPAQIRTALGKILTIK